MAPKFAELLAKHGSDAVEIHTFHQMAYTLLGRLGVKVPPYAAGHEAMVKASGIQKTHAIAFVENFLDSEAYRTLPGNQKLFKTHDGLFFCKNCFGSRRTDLSLKKHIYIANVLVEG